MKYWRGYLTAAILLACTFALREFARAHSVLVDMIYPYVTRMAQDFLTAWSGGVEFCLWQMLVLVLLALGVALTVLTVIFKWNPIQIIGWVCTAVAAVFFLNTALYGLNEFSGPLSEDIRLEETDYTITELEEAAIYFRDEANKLAVQVPRDSSGQVAFADFDTLSVQAAEGFDALVYDHSLAVFAGPTQPVKKLGWTSYYTSRGITGTMVGITGEAAVNPETPAVLLPFAMCEQMAHRMSIVIPRDGGFAAYMACLANEDVQFQYSGALMGYRYCIQALAELDSVTGSGSAQTVSAGESAQLQSDLAVCDAFLGTAPGADAKACDLLTSWHIQEIVLPTLVEDEKLFDPLDKSQVDLSDNPYA